MSAQIPMGSPPKHAGPQHGNIAKMQPVIAVEWPRREFIAVTPAIRRLYQAAVIPIKTTVLRMMPI